MANPRPKAKFKEGNPGKPKGAKNKITKSVKEMVKAAFDELQNDKKANLVAWAKKNPRDFYTIAAKLIPTELDANIQTATIKIVRE